MFLQLLILSFFGFGFSAILPATVNELNVNSYLGLLDNGQISVLNAQLNKNKELETISGYGYYKNASESGKLTVHLDGVPVDAPYWVVKLGEIADDQYQYSVITSPSGISLWVIVRDVDSFNQLYSAEVKKYLDENNFKYVSIKQDDCEPKAH